MLTGDAIKLGLKAPRNEAEAQGAREYAASQGKPYKYDGPIKKVMEAGAAAMQIAKDKAEAVAKAAAQAEQPMMPDLDAMKMADLKALADGRADVKISFGMTKDALIKALRKSLSK